MIWESGMRCHQRRDRGAGDEAVEQHRHALDPGREDRPGHGRDLPTAETAQAFEWRGAMRPMERQRALYRFDLACHAGIIKAAAPAAPLRGFAPEGQGAERGRRRSEEHTSELQSLMRTSYAVFCLK